VFAVVVVVEVVVVDGLVASLARLPCLNIEIGNRLGRSQTISLISLLRVWLVFLALLC
jgi:hypothetical protein